jgi:flagellar biosynthesis protein
MREPIRLAVALKYEEDGADAPMIVASGRGEIADRIVQTAKDKNVPVYEEPSLAQTLVSLELGTEIPPELYQAVAQVIAFVWRLDRKYTPGNSRSNG